MDCFNRNNVRYLFISPLEFLSTINEISKNSKGG